MRRRGLFRFALFAWFALVLTSAFAVDASNRYRSPRNPERKIRRSTELIVLHTTEAPAKSSLNKLCDRGECHYCVTEDGGIYRIVDRDKEAFHAGRSMWNGKEDVDKFSIGIECVGYHDKAMGLVQLNAIKTLVKELQSMYRIPDERVVCHSHVAYGAANKWYKFKHRGRKRCGMLFAMPSVRAKLGLSSRVAYDPDVRAKRLGNADKYLCRILYGSVDTMKSTYGRGTVAAVSPETTGIFSWLDFKRWIGGSERPVAPTPANARQMPPVRQETATPPRSVAELKARGYRLLGSVQKNMTASKLVGRQWNAADTYYTIRNKVIPGNTINPTKIEVGMCVWRKK